MRVVRSRGTRGGADGLPQENLHTRATSPTSPPESQSLYEPRGRRMRTTSVRTCSAPGELPCCTEYYSESGARATRQYTPQVLAEQTTPAMSAAKSDHPGTSPAGDWVSAASGIEPDATWPSHHAAAGVSMHEQPVWAVEIRCPPAAPPTRDLAPPSRPPRGKASTVACLGRTTPLAGSDQDAKSITRRSCGLAGR